MVGAWGCLGSDAGSNGSRSRSRSRSLIRVSGSEPSPEFEEAHLTPAALASHNASDVESTVPARAMPPPRFNQGAEWWQRPLHSAIQSSSGRHILEVEPQRHMNHVAPFGGMMTQMFGPKAECCSIALFLPIFVWYMHVKTSVIYQLLIPVYSFCGLADF
jgi:hypothetical protein